MSVGSHKTGSTKEFSGAANTSYDSSIAFPLGIVCHRPERVISSVDSVATLMCTTELLIRSGLAMRRRDCLSEQEPVGMPRVASQPPTMNHADAGEDAEG